MQSNSAEVAKKIRDVNHKLKHIMRKSFDDIGITMPQGMVISELTKHGEMKISDLSNVLGLSNSTTSGIIDRLEKQEILQRTRSRIDKRIVFVKLSPKSAEMYKKFQKVIDENFKNLLEKGTPDEIEKVVEGLSVLDKILDRNDEKQ